MKVFKKQVSPKFPKAVDAQFRNRTISIEEVLHSENLPSYTKELLILHILDELGKEAKEFGNKLELIFLRRIINKKSDIIHKDLCLKTCSRVSSLKFEYLTKMIMLLQLSSFTFFEILVEAEGGL